MRPVGWEALEQWGDDAARIRPLAGGHNDVTSVLVKGHLAVARLGARSDADLAWETELLQHLDREGLTVPVPIATADGRLFADGLVVMSCVEGAPPETEADWVRMADTLRHVHQLTHGWLQRPGWRSTTDLMHAEIGTKIDLGAMPPEGVARCRAAWARLTGRHTSMSPTSTWCCPITPPDLRTAPTTSPPKPPVHGKPPSAGTMSTRSRGLPRFVWSERRQRAAAATVAERERLRKRHPDPRRRVDQPMFRRLRGYEGI
jgi:hypothetical protein